MYLSELISRLQEAKETHGDIKVMSSSNYGDYHNTEQLDNIEEVQAVIPVESAYSHSGLAFPTEDDYEDSRDSLDDPDREEVLVLRYTYS